MALKQLMLRKKLEAAAAEAEQHRSKRAALDEKKTALGKREQEAETALNELSADSTQEERDAVEQEANAIEAEQATLDQEAGDHETEQARLRAQASPDAQSQKWLDIQEAVYDVIR